MKVFSWIIGVASALFIAGAIYRLLNIFGVETDHHDLAVTHYGRGVEQEFYGASSAPGLFAMILSVMIGTRVGMAVYHRKLSGGLNSRQRVEFRAWFLGFLIMLVVESVLSLVRSRFGDDWFTNTAFNVLSLTAAALTFIAVKIWHDEKLRRLTQVRQ